MGRNSPAKGQVADAERNPITTPSQTVRTANRVAGMPPPTGGLIEQTPSMRNTLSAASSATYADLVKGGNATSIGAMNLTFTPKAEETDQIGGQEAKFDFNATMRQLASEQTRTLTMKQNTELSFRMSQTMKEKHDAELPDTERIAMWMSQLARNTPSGLRDVVWGKSSCMNFAIASVIAARAVEHYKDSNSQDLPEADTTVLQPIMELVNFAAKSSRVLDNSTVAMRLGSVDAFKSPFVFDILCEIFTVDQILTDGIVVLNSRLTGASGNGSLAATKGKPTCFGDLQLSSIVLIEMWRQSVSSIYESIEKQIRKLKTMMAKPDDTYSESTRKVLDQAVAVEKMIHSYAEMCNGIEPEVAETLNVPYTSIIMRYLSIAEAIIQFGEKEAGKITSKLFAQNCEVFLVDVRAILEEFGSIATHAPRILQLSTVLEESTMQAVRDMYMQEAHDSVEKQITFQVPNLPSISILSDGAAGAQAARNAGATVIGDRINEGTNPGNGGRSDYRGDGSGRNGRFGGKGGRTGGRGGGRGDGAGGRVQKEPEQFDSQKRHVQHSVQPTPGRQQRQNDSSWDPTCGAWYWDKTRWMRRCVAGEDGKINSWKYCDICGNHGHTTEYCGEADGTDGASVHSGQSVAQSLAFNVNALRAGLDALPPGQEEIVLEVDDDGVQHINAE